MNRYARRITMTMFFVFMCSVTAEASLRNQRHSSERGMERANPKGNQLSEEISRCENALNNNPSKSRVGEICLELGELTLLSNDWGKAEKYLDRAMKEGGLSDNDMAKASYFLAGVYMKEGRKKEAAELLGQMIQQYPSGEYFDLALLKLKNIYRDHSSEDEIAANASGDPSGGYFSVQVGSFSERDNADKVAGRLQGRFKVFTTKVQKNGNMYWRVRVGEYESKSEALRVANEIKKTEGLPAQVVP